MDLLTGAPTDDGRREMGLALDVADGWKTYWRSPGETGVPPRFDWSGSENVAAVDVAWPAPKLFKSFGMTSVGYGGAVVLPLSVTPADPEKPFALRLDAEFGVCRDICIFERVSLDRTVAPTDPGAHALEIELAAEDVPPAAAAAGLSTLECRLMPAGGERKLVAMLTFGEPREGGTVLIEGGGRIYPTKTTAHAEGQTLYVEAMLELVEGAPWLSRSDLRLTLLSPDGDADIQGCIPGQG